MIETGDGVPWKGQPTDRGQLWRSDDGGDTWQVVSYDRNAMGRAHYYSRMAVAPDDEDEAYFLTASYREVDRWRADADGAAARREAPGGDHHDIWIDPTNANRMIVAHDQGLSITVNRGKTWFRQRLTNAQMYHVTVDNEIPYNVLGNKQDEPDVPRAEQQPPAGRVRRRPRHPARRCGTRWAAARAAGPRPIPPTRTSSGPPPPAPAWSAASSCASRRAGASSATSRCGPSSRTARPRACKYRFVWDAPLQISPHDHNTIYVGSQHVHRTTNGGQSWEVISPDLTLNDKSRMGSSGGLTPDNIGVEYAGVVYGIAESPREKGLIWAGTNDGLVQLTRDNGTTWTNVTKNLAGPPGVGLGAQHRAVTLRRGHGVPDGGLPPDEQSRPVRLPDHRLRRDVEADRQRHPEEHAELRQGDLRGSGAARPAVPGHRERASTCRSTPATPGSRCRTTCRTRRCRASWCRSTSTTWSSRPTAAASGSWTTSRRCGQMTPEVLSADAHLFPLRPAYRFRGITAPSTTVRRPDHRREPAVRRVDQLLREAGGAGRRHDDHQRQQGHRGADDARCRATPG